MSTQIDVQDVVRVANRIAKGCRKKIAGENVNVVCAALVSLAIATIRDHAEGDPPVVLQKALQDFGAFTVEQVRQACHNAILNALPLPEHRSEIQ